MESLFESENLITFKKQVREKKSTLTQENQENKEVKKLFRSIEVSEPLRNLKKYIPYCYYILHLICDESINNPCHGKTLYVNLWSKRIDKAINSKNRVMAINILESLGIIIIPKNHKNNPIYCPKRFSTTYRINPIYISEFIEKDIDIKMCNTLPSDINIGTTKMCNTLPSANHSKASSNTELCNTLPSAKGDIININDKDYVLPPCITHLSNPPITHLGYDYQLSNLFKLNLDSRAYQYLLFKMGVDKDFTVEKSKIAEAKLNNIKNKKFSITIGKECNWYYTQLNNLDSDLRYFITANGEPMLEMDFQTCHVVHLIKAITDDINNGCMNGQLNIDALRTELNAFKDIVLNDDIYNHIANLYYKQHYKHLDRSRRKDLCRDKAKDIILIKWIGGAYQNHKNVQWLKSVFPNITMYMDYFNKDNKKALVIRLMRSEAYLLHDLIIPRVALEHPESIAYTIHDSVISDLDHSTPIYNIMVDESAKYFGFTPVISTGEILLSNIGFVPIQQNIVPTEEVNIIEPVGTTEVDGKKYRIDKNVIEMYDFWDAIENN